VSGAYLGQKSHLQELPRFELSHAQMGSIIFLQRKVVGMTCKRWWQLTYFWNFHPYLWKIPILTHIFLMGWLHHQLAFIILGLPFQKLQGKWIPGFPTNFETSDIASDIFLNDRQLKIP